MGLKPDVPVLFVKMLIPGIIIVLAVLACIGAVKGYEYWGEASADTVEKVAICIIAVGGLGLSEPLWLRFFPHDTLDRFELPNTLDAYRLTAPDGHVFIVSTSILHVQRYGSEGFENGFLFVGGGKHSAAAVSASGNLVICSSGKEMITYTPDGDEIPPRKRCWDGFEGSFSYYPGKAKVPGIAFNRFSALAVPLWHPYVGFAIVMFGVALFKDHSSGKREAP